MSGLPVVVALFVSGAGVAYVTGGALLIRGWLRAPEAPEDQR